jgi:hypothetical protein
MSMHLACWPLHNHLHIIVFNFCINFLQQQQASTNAMDIDNEPIASHFVMLILLLQSLHFHIALPFFL